MRSRKAQSSGNAATLIIIVTALIVLYILFLPPQERAALLGEGSAGGFSGGSSSYGGNPRISTFDLFDQQIGRIEEFNDDTREHSIPSFVIGTTTQGNVLKSFDSIYVRTSVFETMIENVTFRIDEDLTSDVKLSFNTGKLADGRLIVLLNGKQILNDDLEPQTSSIVDLPSDGLLTYNTLTIGASTPGWAFWMSNEYQINNLQITGNVKDVTGAVGEQLFFISEEEIDNLERAVLKFYPDCNQADVGPLFVKVNRRTVFSGVADCNVLNTIELDERSIFEGENDVSFSTYKGRYLMTNLEVETRLKEPVYPIYYFDMDKDFFTEIDEEEERCGEIDGICPHDCQEDLDKDCCFEESNDNFWCDIETSQLNDRCVSFITESTISRCASGYEDYRGDPDEDVNEDLCGDDEDDFCPAGCSQYYDKDCCFENEGAYWCDDVPFARPLSSVCKLGVEPDERASCPSSYVNEDGKRLRPLSDTSTLDEEEELDNDYKVILTMFFPNNDLKSAQVLVNGREVGLETRKIDFEHDISDIVRSGTNSIEIIPRETLDITSMKVQIKRS